jgi:DNA-binding phage protein
MSKISRMLREIIEDKERISIRRVAKAIGVDHGSLYRTLKNGGNPEGNTIEKILDYLGYELQISKRKEVKPGKSKQSERR